MSYKAEACIHCEHCKSESSQKIFYLFYVCELTDIDMYTAAISTVSNRIRLLEKYKSCTDFKRSNRSKTTKMKMYLAQYKKALEYEIEDIKKYSVGKYT